jgi:hypothetical protein
VHFHDASYCGIMGASKDAKRGGGKATTEEQMEWGIYRKK